MAERLEDRIVLSGPGGSVEVGSVGPNAPPTADDIGFTTDQAKTLVVPAPGLLAYVNDADGDLLTVSVVSTVSGGSLTLNPSNGSFTYVPAASFFGTDSFTYRAFDGDEFSSTATVTLTVNQLSTLPTALNDLAVTDEDTAVVIPALANDQGGQGPLSVASYTQPASGTVVLNTDGTFTYVPAEDFNGLDSFTYVATDGVTPSNVATVTIIVNAVNDAPTLTLPGPLSTAEDVPVLVEGLAVADVDAVEGTGDVKVTLAVASGSLTVVEGLLSAGQVSGNGTGSVVLQGPIDAVNATLAQGVTYLGAADFHGTDRLTVVVDDLGNTGSGGPLTATGAVEIRVLSPREQIAELTKAVRDLFADGTLNSTQATAMLFKLWIAELMITYDYDQVAYHVVGAFLHQVQLLTNWGVLTVEQGSVLAAAAEQLRTSLRV